MIESFAIFSGSSQQVSVVNAHTLAVTNLPNTSTTWPSSAVAAVADDDIWVGFDGNFQQFQGYAKLDHWDGASWTTYDVTAIGQHPDSRGWRVSSIIAFSSSEVYATALRTGYGNWKLIQWNGSSWVEIQNVLGGTSAFIDQNSPSGSDMWIGTSRNLSDNVYHWNGSAMDEQLSVASGSQMIGVSSGNGKIYMAAEPSGVVYERTAPLTWSSIFDVGLEIAATGSNAAWANPETGDLWVRSEPTVNNYTVVKWDGASAVTDSQLGTKSTPGAGLAGLLLPGEIPQVWVTDVSTVYVLDDTDGSWDSFALSFAPNALGTFQGDTSTPPYLSDRSPDAGSTGNRPDAPVSVAVRDDEGNLVLSTTRIYVNDTLAWYGGEQMPGFTGGIEAITGSPGYLFGLTPGDDFEIGEQTIRVFAEDDQAMSVDETYTFTVAEFPSENIETIQDEQTAGVDLQLDDGWDLSVESADLPLVAGVDEVVQHLGVGLRLYRGEWFLDTESGIPYYAYVMVSNPNSRVIEGIFRQNIIEDSDTEELSSFEMEIDRATRKLELFFRAKSSVGPVEVSSVFP